MANHSDLLKQAGMAHAAALSRCCGRSVHAPCEGYVEEIEEKLSGVMARVGALQAAVQR